jgi:hypothetical protein
MVAFPVGHYRNRDANEHRRRNQHHDAASQRLNNALPGTCRLRVAQSAILGAKDAWHEKRSEKAKHAGQPACLNLAVTAHREFPSGKYVILPADVKQGH